VILRSLIMDIQPSCPKEINMFIIWQTMKIGDRTIKNSGDDLITCPITRDGIIVEMYCYPRRCQSLSGPLTPRNSPLNGKWCINCNYVLGSGSVCTYRNYHHVVTWRWYQQRAMNLSMDTEYAQFARANHAQYWISEPGKAHSKTSRWPYTLCIMPRLIM
jgi:hypothetical protein